MKKLVVDVENEGLMALLGEQVLLLCANYFYTGKLVGVNEHDILLEDAAIIYETGAFTDRAWKDCQSLGMKLFYVRTGFIESFGKSPK